MRRREAPTGPVAHLRKASESFRPATIPRDKVIVARRYRKGGLHHGHDGNLRNVPSWRTWRTHAKSCAIAGTPSDDNLRPPLITKRQKCQNVMRSRPNQNPLVYLIPSKSIRFSLPSRHEALYHSRHEALSLVALCEKTHIGAAQ